MPPPQSDLVIKKTSWSQGGKRQVVVVEIPDRRASAVTGRGGERIKSIRTTSGAHIKLYDQPIKDGLVRELDVAGTKEQVQAALDLIYDAVVFSRVPVSDLPAADGRRESHSGSETSAASTSDPPHAAAGPAAAHHHTAESPLPAPLSPPPRASATHAAAAPTPAPIPPTPASVPPTPALAPPVPPAAWQRTAPIPFGQQPMAWGARATNAAVTPLSRTAPASSLALLSSALPTTGAVAVPVAVLSPRSHPPAPSPAPGWGPSVTAAAPTPGPPAEPWPTLPTPPASRPTPPAAPPVAPTLSCDAALPTRLPSAPQPAPTPTQRLFSSGAPTTTSLPAAATAPWAPPAAVTPDASHTLHLPVPTPLHRPRLSLQAPAPSPHPSRRHASLPLDGASTSTSASSFTGPAHVPPHLSGPPPPAVAALQPFPAQPAPGGGWVAPGLTPQVLARMPWLQLDLIPLPGQHIPYITVPPVGPISKARRKQAEAEDYDELCVVCMEAPRCVVLVPCAHLVLCQACHSTIRAKSSDCPMCREAFTSHMLLT